MIVMGNNIGVLCKVARIQANQIGAYRYNEREAVFMYDVHAIVELLNVPASVYHNYNAWIQVPGVWRGNVADIVDISVSGRSLNVPIPRHTDVARVAGKRYSDLLAFAADAYGFIEMEAGVAGRVFDLCYSIGASNYSTPSGNWTDYNFKRFMDFFVTKW